MGYRSDVAVMITVENEETFKKYLEDLKKLEIIMDADEVKDNGVDGISITFSGIKWYDDYEDVREFMDWLDSIKEDGESYHLVRIGGYLNDIEEEITGDPKYWVYVERKLVSDF